MSYPDPPQGPARSAKIVLEYDGGETVEYLLEDPTPGLQREIHVKTETRWDPPADAWSSAFPTFQLPKEDRLSLHAKVAGLEERFTVTVHWPKPH